MRNLSNTRPLVVAAAVLVVSAAVMAPPSGAAQAPPQIPATFYGSVTIDGRPAPEGTEVRAFIGGKDCTQAAAPGTIIEDDVARYVIAVVHETQTEGCGKEGAEVTFKVAGATASPGATWTAGPQQVDLAAGPSPSPSPSRPSPSPAAPSPVTSPGVEEDAGSGNTVRYALLGVAAAVALAGVALIVGRKLKGKG